MTEEKLSTPPNFSRIEKSTPFKKGVRVWNDGELCRIYTVYKTGFSSEMMYRAVATSSFKSLAGER